MRSVRARRREAIVHMFSQLRQLPPFPRKRRTQADNVSTRTCVATYVHARSAPWWVCRYGWRASNVDCSQLLRRPLKWTCWRHPCVSWIPQTICSRLILHKLWRLELRRFEQRAKKNSAPATMAFPKAHRIFWFPHLLPLPFATKVECRGILPDSFTKWLETRQLEFSTGDRWVETRSIHSWAVEPAVTASTLDARSCLLRNSLFLRKSFAHARVVMRKRRQPT